MIIWITGQHYAGKTTLADALQLELSMRGRPSVRLDGDLWRTMTLNEDYSDVGRKSNLRQAMLVAVALHADDNWVICAFVSPYRESREWLKQSVTGFLEVYVHTTRPPLQKSHTVDGYEPPLEDFLDVNTDRPLKECVNQTLRELAFSGQAPFIAIDADGMVKPAA